MTKRLRSKELQQPQGIQTIYFGEEGRSKMRLPDRELSEIGKEPLDIVYDTNTKLIYALCQNQNAYCLRAWTLDGKRQSDWPYPKYLKPKSVLWGEGHRVCLVFQNLEDYQQIYGKYRELVGSVQEGTLKDFQKNEVSPLKSPDNDPKYSDLIASIRQLMRKTGFEPIPGWGAKTAVPEFQSSVNFFPVITRPLNVAHSVWTDNLSVIGFVPSELILLVNALGNSMGLYVCRKQSGGDYRISIATNRLFEAIGIPPADAVHTKRIRVLAVEISERALILGLSISPLELAGDKPSAPPAQEYRVLWLDIRGESIEPRQKESGVLARALKRY